jgi:L-aminopeptidase/D-esterase-like protein
MIFLPHHSLDPIFEATAQAVEEAVINALVAADTMQGRDGHRVEAIDHDALCNVMRCHGRLADMATA